MPYYIYFITPEPESRFIVFGRTINLHQRWYAYKCMQPDPKMVGLIECDNEREMKILERKIKEDYFQDAKHRGEWLYHTPEVTAFYQGYTNVDIEKALMPESVREKIRKQEEKEEEARERAEQRKAYQREYYRKYNRERYQNDPEYRRYLQEYQKEYNQRPEVKERRRQNYQRRKAVERRVKVAELKGNGMSGTQIAEVLGENPRTIYNDFSILKSESE